MDAAPLGLRAFDDAFSLGRFSFVCSSGTGRNECVSSTNFDLGFAVSYRGRMAGLKIRFLKSTQGEEFSAPCVLSFPYLNEAVFGSGARRLFSFMASI